MAEQETRADALPAEAEAPQQEEFSPRGTLILMITYLLIFAAAWGLVYFNDLLARR